jgi:hypothetical protein
MKGMACLFSLENMKRGFMIFIFMFIGILNILYSQSEKKTVNPFEIPGRKSEIVQPSESKDLNKFEIEGRLSESENQPVESIQNNNDISNPFDVSHIPLKKRDLSENPVKTNKIQYFKSEKNFIFWLSLLILALLSLVLNTKTGLILNMAKSIENENVLKMLKREEKNGFSGHYVILNIIFLLSFSIFIYLIATKYIETPTMIIWLFILIGVVVFYFGKYILYWFVGLIYPVKKEVSFFSFSMTTYNILFGVILIPLNLVLAFGPEGYSNILVWIGVVILLLLQLVLYFRGLLIGVKFLTNSIVQFFIYLCTLEIAPIVLVFKIVRDMFN